MPPPPPTAVAARARPAGVLPVLWRFGRPHTVTGTVVSALGLTALAVGHFGGLDAVGAARLAEAVVWTLVAGIAVNVFIVGVNQLADVEIDRINKPDLPVASGELSPEAARAVCAACAAVALGLAFTQGAVEVLAVSLGLLIGAAYSLPPLRLKRFPVAAAMSITVVRSCVLNLGVWLHLSGVFGGGKALADVVPAVWVLTAATLPFAFAIAVLKDLPDAEGDRRFGIRTFTVRLGYAAALRLGLVALVVAGAVFAVAGLALLPPVQAALLTAVQVLAVGALWRSARGLAPGDRAGTTRFYQGVWKLFFAEYVVVPLAFLA